jgi:predicted nucleotidyltransferase
MIDSSAWMQNLLAALDATFGDRVWFVGLQGSYGRGEATEASDIDPVVVLDRLTPSDVRRYGEMLDGLFHRELICGFLSGKEELLGWDPADLFQFCYDTHPIKGSLDVLLAKIDGEAIARAMKMGAGNIYHGCVHNMLHEKSEEILTGLFKSASFVIQAAVFQRTGKYLSRRSELLLTVDTEERAILDMLGRLKQKETVDFDAASELLFAWSRRLLA